jgi:hypothetical protein
VESRKGAQEQSEEEVITVIADKMTVDLASRLFALSIHIKTKLS